MKSLSVSYFKAHLAACLRDVERGERYLITEHRRPVAEVRKSGSDERVVTYPAEPFSLHGIGMDAAIVCERGLSRELISEDRGE